MAISLEIGILDLLAEFKAHTFEILCTLKTAGAISACTLKPLLNGVNHLFVLVKPDLHYLYSSISLTRLSFGT